jgi:hypothetical protein
MCLLSSSLNFGMGPKTLTTRYRVDEDSWKVQEFFPFMLKTDPAYTISSVVAVPLFHRFHLTF